MEILKKYIRDIPDFPKKGVIFKDITTLLKDKKMFTKVISALAKKYKPMGIEKVVAVEARGFIFGAALAHALKAGFVPVRKEKKLPHKTIKETYKLEYGTDVVEIHADALEKGEKVIVIDDLLATGGTLCAACQLVKKLKADIVEVVTIIELSYLGGRKKLKKYNYNSLVVY
ncbi:MAG TPA: adenine phosphoribosyltransferase [Candidatus Sumerlaeota bacterium]|nr:MAG: Adenine phosphoribosyltransferase [candidate division BRC1 bacterium ADurb.Bin183]HQH11372.1 adenine phosphoribosyltransferase [Candidatus Sumerlaeota bacterium]HRS00582.1 adenine phosphoribosyltransferase [Candidatus Sumerlaeia bacterium]